MQFLKCFLRHWFFKNRNEVTIFSYLKSSSKKRVLHYQDNIGNINRKCQKLSFSQREQVLKVVLKKTHSKSNDTIIGFFFSKLKLFKKCRSLQNISYNVKNAEIELLELTYQEQNILVYSYHLWTVMES